MLIKRGTSNAFGVPYERGPEDEVVDEEELTRYGEEDLGGGSSISRRD